MELKNEALTVILDHWDEFAALNGFESVGLLKKYDELENLDIMAIGSGSVDSILTEYDRSTRGINGLSLLPSYQDISEVVKLAQLTEDDICEILYSEVIPIWIYSYNLPKYNPRPLTISNSFMIRKRRKLPIKRPIQNPKLANLHEAVRIIVSAAWSVIEEPNIQIYKNFLINCFSGFKGVLPDQVVIAKVANKKAKLLEIKQLEVPLTEVIQILCAAYICYRNAKSTDQKIFTGSHSSVKLQVGVNRFSVDRLMTIFFALFSPKCRNEDGSLMSQFNRWCTQAPISLFRNQLIRCHEIGLLLSETNDMIDDQTNLSLNLNIVNYTKILDAINSSNLDICIKSLLVPEAI